MSTLELPTRPVGTEAVAIPSGATAVTVAGGGVWVATTGSIQNPDFGSDRLIRVDAATRDVRTIGGVGPRTLSLARGDGVVWATHTSNASDGAFRRPLLARVDPASGAVSNHHISRNRRDTATAVAVGVGGVWVGLVRAGTSVRAALTRIDAVTLRPTVRLSLASPPRALAVTGDEVWVIPQRGNTISFVDARTGARAGVLRLGRAPSAIALAADSVWIADEREGLVRRVDPKTRRVVARIPLGGATFGLSGETDGVWAALPSRGTVVRIDPLTNTLTDTIVVGGDPVSVDEADGVLWVGMNSDNMLLRVPL